MSTMICCYYNPYFSDGCSKGANCEFKHLSSSEYAQFVESNKPKKTQSAAYYGFKSAITKFHAHQYSLSSQILKSLLHDDPHMPRYNLWCARSMEKLNLFESAEAYYRRAIATQPRNATFHGRYASLLHFKLNRLNEAKTHYEIALDIRDDINAVHCHYGKLLCDLNDVAKETNYHYVDAARYHFTKCLQIFANDEECHFYFGQLLYKTGDLLKAQYHVKRALHLQNKQYVWHYFYYALICVELEKYCEAKLHLQICLDLQFEFKSTNWDKIYLEYGLLLMFVYNSVETGLKYVTNTSDTNQREQSAQYQELFRNLEQMQNDVSSDSMKMYKKWRNILTNNKKIEENNKECKAESSENSSSLNSKSNSNSSSNSDSFEITVDISSESMSFFLSNNDEEYKQRSEDDIDDTISSSFCVLSIDESADEEKCTSPTAAVIVPQCSVENEFYRFLHSMGLSHYYNRFEAAKINDIRLIEHINDAFLSQSIGFNQKQILIWHNYAQNNWKRQCLNVSTKWKNCDRFLYTLFYNVFAEHGVLTCESFFHYFKKPNDVLFLCGNHKPYAMNIWNLFQNMSQQNAQYNLSF